MSRQEEVLITQSEKRFSNCDVFESLSLKHSFEGNPFSKCYTLSTAAVLSYKVSFYGH